MALVSRHNAILDAVVTALNADADLAAVRTFQKRKRAIHRGNTWVPGAYVTGERRGGNKYHETSITEIVYPVAIWIVDPTNAKLIDDDQMIQHLGTVERVESIFDFKAHAYMPASLRALDSAYTGDDLMKVQKTEVEVALVYDGAAFEQGYDVSVIYVRVYVNVPKRNVSTLGA